MIIKTDPTIRSLQGKFPKSSLIMQNLFGKRHTSAKSYAVPTSESVRSHQSLFSIETGRISDLLKSVSPEFLIDLKEYTSIFNLLHVSDNKLPIPYQNIFSMLCYAAQKSTGFDLSMLNADSHADLFVCVTTIKCFIACGYIPPIGNSYYVGFAFMHDLLSGSVLYCSNPDMYVSSSLRSFYELEFTHKITTNQSLYSWIGLLYALARQENSSDFVSFYEITDQ